MWCHVSSMLRRGALPVQCLIFEKASSMGVEVGRGGGLVPEPCTTSAHGAAHLDGLWLRKLSITSISQVRLSLTVAGQPRPESSGRLIGPLKRQGASVRSQREAATKVRLRRLTCGSNVSFNTRSSDAPSGFSIPGLSDFETPTNSSVQNWQAGPAPLRLGYRRYKAA